MAIGTTVLEMRTRSIKSEAAELTTMLHLCGRITGDAQSGAALYDLLTDDSDSGPRRGHSKTRDSPAAGSHQRARFAQTVGRPQAPAALEALAKELECNAQQAGQEAKRDCDLMKQLGATVDLERTIEVMEEVRTMMRNPNSIWVDMGGPSTTGLLPRKPGRKGYAKQGLEHFIPVNIEGSDKRLLLGDGRLPWLLKRNGRKKKPTWKQFDWVPEPKSREGAVPCDGFFVRCIHYDAWARVVKASHENLRKGGLLVVEGYSADVSDRIRDDQCPQPASGFEVVAAEHEIWVLRKV